ncbi:interleukin-17 receptor E-like [Lampris incognitus]|uniref:interleukin-17 receptor E-like n=1 Tax=Lampris incognitus TaxID=2546036 RepID=UPI0024B60A99|nr:interleukin-17 receptor E-like [Lampris incognitus]
MWTGAYHVPECSSGNLRSHIPECITGRLQYLVNPEKKEVVVSVSDMLEDEDYRLRLCHKDFICAGTGASALIKKEERTRNVTLRYSRPLPCLCIEGWSDMTDAPRVQVCPFKDRVEELWFGVSFDLVEEALSWEPACPTLAVISLCQKGEEDMCMDLPHAMQTAGRGKITFTKVEPHPQLCMKFTAGSQSWTKCPFAKGKFQVWEAEVLASASGHQEVLMLSQITATFSVGVCVRSERSPLCQPIDTLTVDMKNHKPVTLNLTGDLCKPNSCLQVRRLDVNYAANVLNCHLQCVLQNDAAETASVIPASKDGNLSVTWAVVPAGVCLAVIIIVTLMVHAMRTEPPPLATDCVVPAFQTMPSLHSQISVSDPTQLEDIEKLEHVS